MKPEVYVKKIGELVSSSRDDEALEFARMHKDDVSPPLTLGQRVLVADTLHMAAMMVGMDDYATRREDDAQATPSGTRAGVV